MDRFSGFNPKATLLFFLCEIVLTITLFNPVFIAVSFVSACIYLIFLDGVRGAGAIIKTVIPIVFLVAVFNFAFTHYGETLVFTIRDMRFTLEALFFGAVQGLTLGSVMLWFSAYSKVITAEKFLSVFGRLAPDLALIFSMVLSFIPRLSHNAQQIREARQLLDCDESKLKAGVKSFSALLTITLEESIDTADSMKARGFGKKRTVYSKYRFSASDFIMLLLIILFTALSAVYKISGRLDFIYEPVIIFSKIPPVALITFSLLSILPIATNIAEDIKWHYLKQKI